MTLGTLQTMNLPLADLGEALMIRNPAQAAPAAPTPAPQPAPVPPPAPVRKARPRSKGPAAPLATPLAAAAAVDPMKWWGALTQQFTELATKAVQDAAPQAAAAPKVEPPPAAKAPVRKRAAGPR